jgi:hypothetical protein
MSLLDLLRRPTTPATDYRAALQRLADLGAQGEKASASDSIRVVTELGRLAETLGEIEAAGIRDGFIAETGRCPYCSGGSHVAPASEARSADAPATSASKPPRRSVEAITLA